MSLENQEIIDELKEQGVNEALATGLSFETKEDLSSWVDTFKTSLPEAKTIEKYTKEEIEELAKDPTFKGAKGLQGFIDSVRAKAAKPAENKPADQKPTDPPKFELPEDVKTQLEEVKKLREDLASEKFEKTVTTKAKAAGLDDKATAKILKIVKVGDDDAKIDTEITEMKDFLTGLGVKSFGTPGGGGNSKGNDKDIKAWAAKEKAKREKFTKK